jgi:hypothetical protein
VVESFGMLEAFIQPHRPRRGPVRSASQEAIKDGEATQEAQAADGMARVDGVIVRRRST